MKRSVRKFVAAVQYLYNEYIIELMDMEKEYTHPEECYLPTYLYPELVRKAVICNNIEWNEEAFLKEIECNKNQKYYCSNPLLRKIAESLQDNGRSGYKITDCFNDRKIESETTVIIMCACLFREGEYITKEWRNRASDYVNELFGNEEEGRLLEEEGLVIMYYLLFQTNSCLKINEACYKNYQDIWKQTNIDDTRRLRLEEILVSLFFSIIEKISKKMKVIKNDLSFEISVYKNSIINGVRENVLAATN